MTLCAKAYWKTATKKSANNVAKKQCVRLSPENDAVGTGKRNCHKDTKAQRLNKILCVGVAVHNRALLRHKVSRRLFVILRVLVSSWQKKAQRQWASRNHFILSSCPTLTSSPGHGAIK